MLERVIEELNSQFNIKGLKYEYQTVNEFVFSTDYGHVTVYKDTTETFSTASGYMGILFSE